MPRYFFDLAGNQSRADQEGVELSGEPEARAEAVMFAGQLLRDHPELAANGGELRVHVRRDHGAPVFVMVVRVVAIDHPASLGIDLKAHEADCGVDLGCTCHSCAAEG